MKPITASVLAERTAYGSERSARTAAGRAASRPTITMCLAGLLCACGGAPASTTRAPDEVTATWTAGDDTPLGDADQSSREGTGDQPGGPKT